MAQETKHNQDIPSINKEISHPEMLASFLTDEDLNDVKLKGTDGVEVPANRFLLAARSRIFRAMFFGKYQEAKSPVVDLGFQGNVLRAVVEYILTDSAELINTKKRKSKEETTPPYDFKYIESLVSLTEAASYFHLPELGKRVIKVFKHIWLYWPCLSLAIFQACKMAGPAISSELTETAFKHVRALRFKDSTTRQVSCLSAEILKTILKDDKMEMTEYERFQILHQWMEGGGDTPSIQSDRRAMVANLLKYIFFDRIDPRHLSTTVTASGLVPLETLAEAYKIQALALVEQTESELADTWTTDKPPDIEPPTIVKVTGAGAAAVNGIYKKDGFLNGYYEYSKDGKYEGQPCVLSIVKCPHSFGWYISILDLDQPGPTGDTDFYVCDLLDNSALPPFNGWNLTGKGRFPPPKLLYSTLKHIYVETNA